jgi:hypothetical protein
MLFSLKRCKNTIQFNGTMSLYSLCAIALMQVDLLYSSVSKLATWYLHVQVTTALTATLKSNARAHTAQQYLSGANNGRDSSMRSIIIR